MSEAVPAPPRRLRLAFIGLGNMGGGMAANQAKAGREVLANPADDHTKTVFDPSIRGHTDQFIYKFRKPK